MISFASWIRACRFGPHYNECRRIATNLDAVSNIKLDSRISCEQRRHEGTTSTLTGPLPPKHATNVALDGGTNNNRNIINNNTNNSSQRNTTARLHSLAKMPVSVTYSIIQLVQDRKFSQAVYEYQRIQRDANNSSNKLFINAAFVQALIKAFFALSTDSATARKYADEADKLFARLKQRYMETQDAIARPNSNIYTLLISLNRKAGDTERMEKLMQEAQENFKGKSAAKLQHIISDASIMALGRTGRLREALETFDTMRRDGTANMHSYSAAISAYSANGNTGQMRRIFEEMTQKFGPNIIALNSVLEGYAKNRKYEEAVSLFESIYGDGDYTAAISNNNNNNIRYPLPIDYTYNVMFRVYGKCSSIDYKRAWSQVRNLYHQMHATGVVPNSYIYTALVSACTSIMCRAMEDEEARKNGGGGTSAAAAATTTATATAEAARQSLMEMIDEIQGHVVAQNMCDSHQLQPRSSAIYNSLINAHCKMGRVESAKALLETMQKQLIEPNAHTFAPIIDYYCARGDTKGTRDILAEMKRSGVEPNTFIYNTLMWACSRRGDHDTLWGLFNEMRNSSEQKQPDRRSYELAVRSSFEQGEQKRAMELLDEMKSRGLGPTAEVVNVAAEHLIRLGQCETAMQMLRSIRSRSSSSSVEAHHQPDQADSKTVALLIKAAVESKQYDQAIDVFKQASKAKPGGATSLLLTTEIYNAAIDCYVRQFRHDKANAILREMKQRASADPSGRCKPNHLTYSLVISAFVQRRKLEYPVVLLNEMRRMGMRPMPWVYREFLARVSSSPASARFLIPVPVVAPKSEQQQQQQQQQQQEKKGQQQQQQQQQLATQEFTRDQLVDYLYQCMQDDGYDLRDRTVCDALLPTFEARVKDAVMPTYCASSEWEAEQERQAGSFEDFYYINQYRPTSSS